MSFTYSNDPSSSKVDECRFLLGDTDETQPVLQNEEIEYIIASAGSNRDKLLYELFSQAATAFSRQIKRSLGPQSEDPTTRLEFFKEKACEYKSRLTSGGISIPKFAHPKVFRIGMQNNPPWPKKPGGC